MKPAGALASLEAALDRRLPVIAQAHDFPDVDAFGAAWALASLLAARGYDAAPAFRGGLRSRSLANMARELGAPVATPPDEASGGRSIVAVDCIPENGNVELFPGRLAAAIDHHVPAAAPAAPFADLRIDSGSCCSIIVDYWREAALEPERRVATALLAGLQADTDFLSRGAGPLDVEAFHWLSSRADRDQAARLVKTALAPGELRLIATALQSATLADSALYAVVGRARDIEAPALLADFALRAEDVSVALVASVDDEGVRISIRSRDPLVPAFDAARALVAGIGSGGGHGRSAGGRIALSDFPGEEALGARFFDAVRSLRAHRS